jgi:N-acyl-D-amino-acid deacylase
VTEIAAARHQNPVETFFDLALEDNLGMEYAIACFGVPEEYLGDSDTLIGLSDAGAHVTMVCIAGYTTEMLGDLVASAVCSVWRQRLSA